MSRSPLCMCVGEEVGGGAGDIYVFSHVSS